MMKVNQSLRQDSTTLFSRTNALLTTKLSQIKHLFLDLDGTVYNGDTLLDCSLPFFETIGSLGIRHTFLTNNPSKSSTDYLLKLNRMGLKTSIGDLYTSAMATVHTLRRDYPEVRRVFALGTPSMIDEFSAAGFEMTSDDPADIPDAVIIGFDTTLTYSRLCRAAWWLRQGKPYIATNPDLVCPTDLPTVLVDCGSICAMLEKATGRYPDRVLGKPDPAMIAGIVEQYSLMPHQMAMVGDRLYTDILLAHRANILSVLVLTGESTSQDALQADPPADIVVPSLAEFGELLQHSRLDKATIP